MEKFLREYLNSLLESVKDEYNVDEITDEDKKDIISTLMCNDAIWNVLDEAIYQEIRNFEKEEEK